MLKDRKFWTGMLAGAVVTGSITLLGPLNAAGPSEADYLKAIAGALVQMRDNGKAIQSDVAALKASAERIDKGVTQLGQSQGINPNQGR